LTNDINEATNEDQNFTHVSHLVKDLISTAKDDDDDEAEVNEDINPNSSTTLRTQPHRVTLYFGTANPIMLADLFDFASKGRNNNGFEMFNKNGKDHLAMEMHIYERASAQTQEEIDAQVGSQDMPITV